MNDSARRQIVENDETLYQVIYWYAKDQKIPVREAIRKQRQFIDDYIVKQYGSKT